MARTKLCNNLKTKTRLLFISLAVIFAPAAPFSSKTLYFSTGGQKHFSKQRASVNYWFKTRNDRQVATALPLKASAAPCVSPRSFFIARTLFFHGLGATYAIAFAVALRQNKALVGDDGITPARRHLQRLLERSGGSRWKGFRRHPTLLWLADLRDLSVADNQPTWTVEELAATIGTSVSGGTPLDPLLDSLALSGLALSSAVAATGAANAPVCFALWAIYFSIVQAGQAWYAYGWESQLLETGFLAAFLAPPLALPVLRLPFTTSTPSLLFLTAAAPAAAAAAGAGAAPVSPVAVWGLRWLLFRIMLGAGLIKLRGDRSWRDLTATTFFYETQPAPNPLSPRLHRLPRWWHRAEGAGTLAVEVLLPWLLLLPLRWARLAGGLVQISFQLCLLAAGNLSFLNYLTVLPALLCLDDAFLAPLGALLPSAMSLPSTFTPPVPILPVPLPFPPLPLPPAALPTAIRASMAATTAWITAAAAAGTGSAMASFGTAARAAMAATSAVAAAAAAAVAARPRIAVDLTLAAVLAVLSVAPVRNLMSARQAMNRSYGPWRLCNTYGAFGTITTERLQVVISGTREFCGADTEWHEYEFPIVGGPHRPLRFVAPYHHRMDWALWLAACGGGQPWQATAPWLPRLLGRLMRNDPAATRLLRRNPFADGGPPMYIKAEMYRYRFADPRSAEARAGAPWQREYVGRWFPFAGRDEVDKLDGMYRKLQ